MAHHNAATKGKDKNARPSEAVYRLNEAMKMRRAGKSFREIVEAGIYASRGAACNAVNKELSKVVAETKTSAEEYRQLELERLDELMKALWPQATHACEVPADEESEPEAYAARLAQRNQAADRLLKVIERRCSLLGIDKIDLPASPEVPPMSFSFHVSEPESSIEITRGGDTTE